jgi:hypothetical protein
VARPFTAVRPGPARAGSASYFIDRRGLNVVGVVVLRRATRGPCQKGLFCCRDRSLFARSPGTQRRALCKFLLGYRLVSAIFRYNAFGEARRICATPSALSLCPALDDDAGQSLHFGLAPSGWVGTSHGLGGLSLFFLYPCVLIRPFVHAFAGSTPHRHPKHHGIYLDSHRIQFDQFCVKPGRDSPIGSRITDHNPSHDSKSVSTPSII